MNEKLQDQNRSDAQLREYCRRDGREHTDGQKMDFNA